MTLGLSPAPTPVVTTRPALIAPAPALAPLALTPVLPAPALPALQGAAVTPIDLGEKSPSESVRDAAAAPFEEALARAPLSAPLVETGGERQPRYRLAPLGFEDLASSEPAGPPVPRSPEPKPFLLRHYRLARFFAAPLVRLAYAVRVSEVARVPRGPALIISNHVSFMDPVLLSFATNRPMRFLMYRNIYETYGLQWLFRSLGAIPISPKDPKEVIEESLYRARRALIAGETVVVFPEGKLTRDGDFSPFRRGFERVAAGTGAPVIPARIDGMWGSAFSRHPNASFLSGLFRRIRGRRPVSVRFGPALPRADSSLARDAVALLARPNAL